MAKRIFPGVPLIAVALAGLFLLRQGGADAGTEAPAVHESVSPREAHRVMRENRSNPDFVVIDVRSPQEYQEERIDGAVMIDFTANSFREELERLDRGKTYLVYCRTGRRSGSAVSMMEEMKFKKIYHLSGGITKWKEEGLPTTK